MLCKVKTRKLNIMKKVAIIGPIGSGKSEVLRICSDMDLPTISSDHIARLLMELPGAAHDAILEEFGKDFSISGSFGKIDRHKLGEFVFSNPEKLRTLEDLIHPHVWQLATAFFLECESKEEEICFVEVSAPSESIANQFDELLMIVSPVNIRRDRCLNRGMEIEDFDARNQYQELHCRYSELATKEIQNSSSINDLEISMTDIIKTICESK